MTKNILMEGYFLVKLKNALISLLIIVLFFTGLSLKTEILKAQELTGPESLSIVLIIDVSGSMEYTDPMWLREMSSQIFIDLLLPGDYLSIIIFDHEAQEVYPLKKIENPKQREEIKEALSGRLAPRGSTDFLEALEMANAQFKENDWQGARPVVVMLTDGEPNPDSSRGDDEEFMEAYMESLWKEVTGFALERYPIYTVGFSEEIDPQVMRKISMETKGEDYVLSDPGEIAPAFFALLSSLRNRQNIVDYTFNLQEEPGRFSFTVDQNTQQINLLVVNPLEGECEVTFHPPAGSMEDFQGLQTTREDRYMLLNLQQFQELHWGTWEVSISGSEQIRVMGDLDPNVKAWTQGAVGLTQHPLNEPLNFRVRVERGQDLPQLPVRVEVVLKRPGQLMPLTLLLQEEGDFFTGVFDQVDRAGEYEYETRVLVGDELISTTTSRVSVQNLPVLTTDFWIEEGYHVGEEMVVTASLLMGGHRLQEGNELRVDHIWLVLDYEDGEKITLPLFDSGQKEHGDIKVADGFWSNRLSFSREGAVQASLLASGRYRGSDFMLDKKLGSFYVYHPGTIIIELKEDNHWASPGGRFSIPLLIKNNSPFKETLLVVSGQDMGSFSDPRIKLEPGEVKEAALTYNLKDDAALGDYNLMLDFQVVDSLMEVQPSQLSFGLEVTTVPEALIRRIIPLAYGSGAVVLTILAVLLLFFLVGLILYWLLVYRRIRVGGSLIYYRNDAADELFSTPRKIRLKGRTRERVVITFNSENQDADFYIEGSTFNYDLIIEILRDKRGPAFIQGWKCLLGRYKHLLMVIRCTGSGVIEFEDLMVTQKNLYHGDSFTSGDYSFQYVNAYGRRFTGKGTESGVNILEGKMINPD
ncbi:vWA domain-containing protein [Candidatus Contubernalis alkaliaceticus]|uniref:vWA domain-containing protein n=1 Tax=Candidatus Contubernalis alkaliaceticus TaxID=338645 RepID=UPI001F4BF341|nr:vWA domain-containing protein [Candidatus Contubernalis alkalaceticus]UNC93449.1 VWA domain-containing protein [Candidatus Contubernalis alkalaceticus]